MPVCSPQLLLRRTLTDASDLLRYPLLHDEHREDWARGVKAVGLAPLRAAWAGVH